MSLTHASASGDFALANADVEHHIKFIGTTSEGKVPSPVEMVESGMLPVSYLDRFGSDSAFRQEIDEYRATVAHHV